ncbi:MAG: helix-turn-helix domain-containing protein [Bacteroidales bacterium]|nr:helix-turn-helix domain-containing protein [Bacteroidales bacterium]
MSTNETSKSNFNQPIFLPTASELKEFAIEVVEQTLIRVGKAASENSSDTLFTTEQVCKILSVDPSTLWRWNKRGYLTSVRVGGLNRYFKSDIDRILNSVK